VVNPVYRCVVPVPLTVKLFISESDGEMGTENEDFCDAEYYFRIFDMCKEYEIIEKRKKK
jgi:hypothetical protein